jgi:ADP-ribose pyrophosphatase YjhB (NUDIX family)
MSELKKIAGIVVKHKNKLLLCKRSKNESLPLEWSIPSGHMEKNETPIDAAVREFKEETNLKVDKDELKLVGILSSYIKNKTEKTKIIFVYGFDSKKELIPDLDKAKHGKEHSECKYFSKNNLPESKKTESMIKILKKF